MKPHALRNTVACCLLLSIAAPLAALADPGENVHVDISMKMQMTNVQMSMPPHTISQDICGPKQAKHDLSEVQNVLQQTRDKKKNCTVSNFKIEGTTASLHYSCTGQMQLDGDGTFTMKAGGGSQGTVHTSGNVGGQPLTMDFTYDVTPTGTACEYTPHSTTP